MENEMGRICSTKCEKKNDYRKARRKGNAKRTETVGGA
jgi:hypothetical protein